MTESKASADINTDNIPEVLPILPLFEVALFPKMVLPLVVVQGESIKLVDEAMSKDRIIGLVVSRKQTMQSRYSPEDLYDIGTSAMILKMAKSEDSKAQLLVQGLSRFKVKDFIEGKPYLQANVEHLKAQEIKDKEISGA